MGFLLDLFIFAFSLALSLGAFVPLTGVLIRFRANYNPKSLQLDADGGAAPHTGPVIQSYFAMLVRVYRIEGVPGLYKGLMPTLVSSLIVSVIILIFLDASDARHGAYRAPDAGPLGMFIYSLGNMVISLPTAVVTYRAITTPHKLPYFNPVKSLRILLTPTERSKPWILYLTPGLMAAQFAHIVIVALILSPLRRVLLPSITDEQPEFSPLKFGLYFFFVVLAVGVLCPLEVVATRLSIQRNHASAEYNSVPQEVAGDEEEETTEYAGTDEDVIGLRNEEEPYVGLVDCTKSIINEEGWQALYRAWWLTLLGTLLASIG